MPVPKVCKSVVGDKPMTKSRAVNRLPSSAAHRVAGQADADADADVKDQKCQTVAYVQSDKAIRRGLSGVRGLRRRTKDGS